MRDKNIIIVVMGLLIISSLVNIAMGYLLYSRVKHHPYIERAGDSDAQYNNLFAKRVGVEDGVYYAPSYTFSKYPHLGMLAISSEWFGFTNGKHIVMDIGKSGVRIQRGELEINDEGLDINHGPLNVETHIILNGKKISDFSQINCTGGNDG